MAQATIQLANKEYRVERPADELLALFAVLSPILTGRDCFLLTADHDVVEQTQRMCKLLFDDYGAYLMGRDLRENPSRYEHRHADESPFFEGDGIAIERLEHPDYLLPPPEMMKTCATGVINVNKLTGFVWISARNLEPAIAFQDEDPIGRKGDPGDGRSILFSLPVDATQMTCKVKYHFVTGTPRYLKLLGDHAGPVALFDLARAFIEMHEPPPRRRRVLSPFAAHQQRLADQARRKGKR